jgi:RimJ/RimL family protein N-acetyltransferase
METERLVLRNWRETDRAHFATINADPVVMEHFPSVQSADDSNAFVDRIEQHFADHGWGYWAIELRGVAPFIGFVGLSSTTLLDAPMVEIGWRLDKRHWNEGYATEAARAALDFGFGDINLDEIVAYTAHANVPSRRVMEKSGWLTTLPRTSCIRTFPSGVTAVRLVPGQEPTASGG